MTGRSTLYVIEYDPEDNDKDNVVLRTIGKILLKEEPIAIAVNDNTQMAYASNLFSNSVSVIDLYLNKIIINIPVGNGPRGISIDPVQVL